MRTNAEGLRLIRKFEGLRLRAYRDAAGIPTIGYGHTGAVRLGDEITRAEAERLLDADVAAIEHSLHRLIRVPLSGNEFSALVSLAFNIGPARLLRSSVLKRLHAGDHQGAGDAILYWDKARVNGKLVALSGLARRRAAERALFLTPDPPTAKKEASAEH